MGKFDLLSSLKHTAYYYLNNIPTTIEVSLEHLNTPVYAIKKSLTTISNVLDISKLYTVELLEAFSQYTNMLMLFRWKPSNVVDLLFWKPCSTVLVKNRSIVVLVTY